MLDGGGAAGEPVRPDAGHEPQGEPPAHHQARQRNLTPHRRLTNWLPCPLEAVDLGEKFAVHKSLTGDDCWLSCVRSVRCGGRDSIAMRQFSP